MDGMQSAALGGRKQLIFAAGINSRSGDTRRLFGGFQHFLHAEGGYAPEDFLEATYGGEYAGGRWVGPAPYDMSAFDAPLAQSVAHCAQALLWAARQRPAAGEWHLVGFSLGGLVLLEAAIVLHRRATDTWGQRLRSITTLSSPLNGCALGSFSWLGDLFGPGAIGPELCALGDDPRHRRRLEADVAGLRAASITVTTLVEADDAVIQPTDGIVGPVRPDLVISSPAALDDSLVARHLGHGRIVHDPAVWRRLLLVVGPQRAGSPAPAAPVLAPRPLPPAPDQVLLMPPPARDALLDLQLEELKARMRAEGRLPETPPSA